MSDALKVECYECRHYSEHHDASGGCKNHEAVFSDGNFAGLERCQCPLSESDVFRVALAQRDAQLAAATSRAEREHERAERLRAALDGIVKLANHAQMWLRLSDEDVPPSTSLDRVANAIGQLDAIPKLVAAILAETEGA